MSIENELSSDIAVALLTRGKTDPKQLNDLRETILRIHSILQSTTAPRSKRAPGNVADRFQIVKAKQE